MLALRRIPLLLIFPCLLLLALAHAVSLASAQGDVIYVDADAGGAEDGSSWNDAYTDLQDALAVAGSGDEIWVATGVYTPGTARTDTFQLKNRVALYGGFAGGETERSERDWQANVTVLSGDIDGNDTTDAYGVVIYTTNITGSNSYHVVTGSGTDGATILDGVTVTAGQAIGDSLHHTKGGGMLNDSGNATLTNVIFRGNSAAVGSGMFNNNTAITLTNVTFSANSSSNAGGGMYNLSSSATLTNVTFSGNSTNGFGGGMLNKYSSITTLADVTFSENSAKAGGGMYNLSSSVILTNVTFSRNSANRFGGGMFNSVNYSRPILTNVTFHRNSAAENGGGMYNSGDGPILTNVTFRRNSATADGGGMFNSNSDSTLTNVTFSRNSATYGSGMYNSSCDSVLTNVTFSGNNAIADGGGMFYSMGNATLTNVTFSGNRATKGSGMFYDRGNATLTNVIFSGNRATTGGGMFNEDNSLTLTNVTFSGNRATAGGGMYNSDSSITVTNSILWDNSASYAAQIYNDRISTVSISHSIVQGGYSGDGILDADPQFITPVDPAAAPITAGNLRLRFGSPAIDVGDTSAVSASTDLDGRPRVAGGGVDMGAYESDYMNLLQFSSSEYEAAEGEVGAHIIVKRLSPNPNNPYADVTVSVTSNDGTAIAGSDYEVVSETLTIPAGQTQATFPFTVLDDAVDEPRDRETVNLSLSSPQGAELGAPASATLTITDNDTAAVNVRSNADLVTTEAGGAVTFTVALNSKPTGFVTVTLSSSDTGEGIVRPATLLFDAGTWNLPRTVTVSGVDDRADDGDISYAIKSVVSSDDPFYDGIGVVDVPVINRDNDHRLYVPLVRKVAKP